VAAAAVTVFLLLVVVEVLRNALNHLSGKSAVSDIPLSSFVVMLVTIAINLFVIRYEGRAAQELGSEILMADATQTRGAVWTSAAVLAALAGVKLGLPILDPIAALLVAGFIAHAGYQIAYTTTGILSDRIVIDETEIQRVVLDVPGVIGCHQIRTRGPAD